MLDEIRVEPITVGQYLSMVENEDIKSDQAVQRDFCWGNNMMNSLIYSGVSRKIFIPTIILAEQKKENGVKQTYIVDGGHRTETLRRFRFEGYKITKDMRSYLVPYKKKKLDEHGQVVRDEYGDIVWKFDKFDLRNKTYDDLPDDLKDKFNGCPLSQAIYQDCTPEETSELVQLYNNHVAMNVSQKSLTYIGKFANEIKRIKDSNRFLMNGSALTENEKKKGIWERVISESVMAVYHIDDWKKQPQKMCEYLNDNSSIKEYKNIEEYFNRLTPYIDKLENRKVSDLFASKDIAVLMMLFDKFDKLHISDEKFSEFLSALVSGLDKKEVDGESWEKLDLDKHTKDKSVLLKKVNHLETLMMEYLHSDIEKMQIEEKNDLSDEMEDEEVIILDFVKEVVNPNTTEEDINMYYEMLNRYKIDKHSPLLHWDNEPSLIALIAYTYENEMDLDDWIVDYFNRNNEFFADQKENYTYMLEDYKEYLEK